MNAGGPVHMRAEVIFSCRQRLLPRCQGWIRKTFCESKLQWRITLCHLLHCSVLLKVACVCGERERVFLPPTLIGGILGDIHVGHETVPQ